MPLYVKCKGCGKDFSSTIQMIDTSTWHKPNITEQINLSCPECGNNFLYLKNEHFFK